MSLLLDALKKAAQEKLEKQHQSGQLQSKPEYQAPIEKTQGEPSEEDGESAQKFQTDSPVSDDALQLEPLEEDELHIDTDAFSENIETDYEYRRAEVLASELRAFDSDTETREAVAGRDNYPDAGKTGQAVPDWSMQPLQTAYHSTPRQAAEIFISKAPNRNKRIRQFSFLMGIALLTVLAGMLAYYYLAKPGENLLVIKSDPPLRETLQATTSSKTTAEVDPALLIEQEDYDSLLAADLGGSENQREAFSPEDTRPQESQAEHQSVTAMVEPKSATPVRETPSPRRTAIREGHLDISKTTGKESLQDVLMRGYNAYNDGEFENAEVAYRQALTRAPDSRDAILGMAAVRFAQGDTQTAAAYYRKLLQRDPKDELAFAALAGIEDATGRALPKTDAPDESLIKLLLAEKPDADYLHFTLGNIFANGQRWAEAQQAYFDAHRLAPGNPDYAFNLAVSLDHLGKKDEAALYYRQSLTLTRDRKSNFDIQVAVDRLAGLQKP